MPNYRHERLPLDGKPSNPNVSHNSARLDAQAVSRARGPAWDSDDPHVRWQYLVDHRLIGGNPPAPPPDGGNQTTPDNAANIRRWEIALGLRQG